MTIHDSEYEGFFAEFYDILHADLPDVAAYVDFARLYGPEILELGSGTGRLTIPLARAGNAVTGLELSPGMLGQCRRKLETESQVVQSRITLMQGDMTDFQIPRMFDLAIAPCNTFCHMLSLEDMTKAMSCIHGNLREGGMLIIDNSLPDIAAMVESGGKEEVLEFTHPEKNTRIVDRFTPEYDFLNQMEHDHIVLQEYDGESIVREAESQVTLTWFFPRELEFMIQRCGFQVMETRGSLTEGGGITENSREMVFICRRIHL